MFTNSFTLTNEEHEEKENLNQLYDAYQKIRKISTVPIISKLIKTDSSVKKIPTKRVVAA